MPKTCKEAMSHVRKSRIKVCSAEDIRRSKTCGENTPHGGRGGASGTGGTPFYKPKFNFMPTAKQMEKLRIFFPSIVCYSIATFLCMSYICEWKDLLRFMPYYRGKYKDDVEEN